MKKFSSHQGTLSMSNEIKSLTNMAAYFKKKLGVVLQTILDVYKMYIYIYIYIINFPVLLIERKPTGKLQGYIIAIIAICSVLAVIIVIVVVCGKCFNAEVLYMITS